MSDTARRWMQRPEHSNWGDFGPDDQLGRLNSLMLPARPATTHFHASHPLHDLCLFRLGVYLGELWLLSPLADWLAANGRNRFLLTAPPLRLPRAVGSPVSPVATV
jgi:hypothetical protein